MKKDFYILGPIVNSTIERWSEEDVCPQQFKKFISDLKTRDELTLHFNSVGGDCYAGLTIANWIRELQNNGVKVVALVEGLAASIASVIACACDTIKMFESSFLMCHRCWVATVGNSEDLKKEADTMDKIDAAIRSFYHRHFDLTDEELEKMMAEETWISGAEVKDWKLDCEVLPDEKQYRIAASIRKMNYTNIPERLRNSIMENEKIEKTADVVETPVTPVTPVEEKPVEEPKLDEEEVKAVEEQIDEQIENDVAEPVVEETVTKAEADKRVSGMQSTMAKKMDAMKKEYDAKILDFENQLKTKDEELKSARADITSLEQRLEVANKELSEKTSALEEKSNALATLNAGVLTPTETKESWRNLKGQKFLDYVNAHKKELSK